MSAKALGFMKFIQKRFIILLIALLMLAIIGCRIELEGGESEAVLAEETAVSPDNTSASIIETPKPTATSAPELDPYDLLETAENNFQLLNTYSISATRMTRLGTFPIDDGESGWCDVNVEDVLVYCFGGFDVYRDGNQYWRASPNVPWAEPVESQNGRMDVLKLAFQSWTISATLVEYVDQGFPSAEISSIVKELEYVQETTFDGHDVYELQFQVDDSYHNRLDHGGGLATQTMGTMRDAATQSEGSGTGYVYIDIDQELVRYISIESIATIDDFDAETATTVTMTNFNKPMDFASIEMQINEDISQN